MEFPHGLLDLVRDLQNNNLPAGYEYHNYQHSVYIVRMVDEIGRAEGCTPEEIDLLKLAALWHDVGYINVYEGHEEEGCNLAKQYLPAFGISRQHIERVCDLIRVTKIPQSPKDKLGQVLADADLEYLGTPDAERMATQLYHELKYRTPALTIPEWNKIQVAFIQKHHFFTSYCIQTREPLKQAYLRSLMEKTG